MSITREPLRFLANPLDSNKGAACCAYTARAAMAIYSPNS